MNEWLNKLRPDDEVAVKHFRHFTIARVSSITRTQVHVEGNHFSRDSGTQTGGSDYIKRQLLEPTEERRAAARRDILLQRISTTNWQSLDNESLESVFAVIESARTKQSSK
jgi:hypothetical protein